MIKIDEKHQTAHALRDADAVLQDLHAQRSVKVHELNGMVERYTARQAVLQQRGRIDFEADRLLNGATDPAPGVSSQSIEQLEHDISVMAAAIEKQQKVVSAARGQFSVTVCKANQDQYILIERRIAKAVQELAAANEAEIRFFDELSAAGVSPNFRPMRIDQVGLASDPNSRASLHRREVEQFLPEAL